MCERIPVGILGIRFHENAFRGSTFLALGRTERHYEENKHIFCNFVLTKCEIRKRVSLKVAGTLNPPTRPPSKM